MPCAKWQSILVFLPGKSYGPGAWWATGHGVAKKLDTTLLLSTHVLLPQTTFTQSFSLSANGYSSSPSAHSVLSQPTSSSPEKSPNIQTLKPVHHWHFITCPIPVMATQLAPQWFPLPILQSGPHTAPEPSLCSPRGIRVPPRSTLSSSQSHCPQYRHLPTSFPHSLRLLFHPHLLAVPNKPLFSTRGL